MTGSYLYLIIEACIRSKALTDNKGFKWLIVEALSMPAFWNCLSAAVVVFYPLYHLLHLADLCIGTMDLIKILLLTD